MGNGGEGFLHSSINLCLRPWRKLWPLNERDTRAVALPYINVMGPGLACAVWAQLLKISAVFMYFVAVADYLVPLYSTRT